MEVLALRFRFKKCKITGRVYGIKEIYETQEEKEEKIPRILVFCKAAVYSDASGCRGTRILLLRRLRPEGKRAAAGSQKI